MKPVEYKMGLMNLATGKKEVIQNINRFNFSRNGKFLAVYLAPPKESRDKGAVLLVKNLGDGTTRTIGNVTEYAFNKKSDYLAYIVESANTAGNSAELFHLQNYTLKIMASDTAKFSKLTWSSLRVMDDPLNTRMPEGKPGEVSGLKIFRTGFLYRLV